MNGWIISFVILSLLAILPLGAHVRYDAGGSVVKLILGPVRLQILPKKPKKPKKGKKAKLIEEPKPPKEKKPKKEKAPKEAPLPEAPPPQAEPTPAGPAPQQSPDAPAEPPTKKGGSLTDFIPFVQLVGKFLNHFRWKLLIRRLFVEVVLGGDDPADLAINYGRVNAIFGNLNPWLERNFRVRARDLRCNCDFTTDKTLVTADVAISLSLGHLLWMVVKYAVLAVVEFIKFRNKRKSNKAV